MTNYEDWKAVYSLILKHNVPVTMALDLHHKALMERE